MCLFMLTISLPPLSLSLFPSFLYHILPIPRFNYQPTIINRNTVDLPEFKGSHRKFRTIVSSLIGMECYLETRHFGKPSATLCVIPSVVIFCKIFLKSSTGRWAHTAATASINKTGHISGLNPVGQFVIPRLLQEGLDRRNLPR